MLARLRKGASSPTGNKREVVEETKTEGISAVSQWELKDFIDFVKAVSKAPQQWEMFSKALKNHSHEDLQVILLQALEVGKSPLPPSSPVSRNQSPLLLRVISEDQQMEPIGKDSDLTQKLVTAPDTQGSNLTVRRPSITGSLILRHNSADGTTQAISNTPAAHFDIGRVSRVRAVTQEAALLAPDSPIHSCRGAVGSTHKGFFTPRSSSRALGAGQNNSSEDILQTQRPPFALRNQADGHNGSTPPISPKPLRHMSIESNASDSSPLPGAGFPSRGRSTTWVPGEKLTPKVLRRVRKRASIYDISQLETEKPIGSTHAKVSTESKKEPKLAAEVGDPAEQDSTIQEEEESEQQKEKQTERETEKETEKEEAKETEIEIEKEKEKEKEIEDVPKADVEVQTKQEEQRQPKDEEDTFTEQSKDVSSLSPEEEKKDSQAPQDQPSDKAADSTQHGGETAEDETEKEKRVLEEMKALDGVVTENDGGDDQDFGPEMVITKSVLRSSKNRYFAQYACVSKAGATPYAPSKINQDRGLVLAPFGFGTGKQQQNASAVFGVFDGHGQNGQLASQFIVDKFGETFKKYLKEQVEVPKAAEATCIDIDKALVADQKIGSGMDYSGSTGVMVYVDGPHMWIINVGDSRAVLGKNIGAGRIEAENLSQDQTGTREDEKKRVEDAGGRVGPAPDWEDGPVRVWLKFQDIPGIAMTRSFGDSIAAGIGVTAVPEVTKRDLSKDDAFMIIASDGIWEFISSQEAVDMVSLLSEPDAEAAVSVLVDEAVLRWNEEEEGFVDDITCVVVYFSHPE